MSRGRAGLSAEQIARFEVTDDELRDLENYTPEEGEDTMPIKRPQPLRPNATREEKLAALPPYPRDGRGKFVERKLTETADAAFNTLTELDGLLDEVGEAFQEAFARDDARAAAQGRIRSTAQAHRDRQRRR